jgi:hypothetical protein
MSFWLSASYKLQSRLRIFDLEKVREPRVFRTVQTSASSYDDPHALRASYMTSGIVAIRREVVQEKSYTQGEMPLSMRLFNNTLQCGNLTHNEIAVSGDSVDGHQSTRFLSLPPLNSIGPAENEE